MSPTIWTAQGILMELHTCSAERAMELLRQRATDADASLLATAHELVRSRRTSG